MALVPRETVPPLTRLGELPVRRFLETHWQREPCMLRGVFADFQPELDERDIAGLACDPLAESRLVTGSYPAHDWTVRHGPFEEDVLASLPDRGWTLLVQDVEKHYPPLSQLMARFAFLPSWRLDDLMVSVAAAGGSVGPHADQYDVFLLQASGRRRWEISRTFDAEVRPDCELKVLNRFTAETSWELEPGDVLYLPPGVAHHGIALDLGMTWSIGLRSPSQADLHLALGEWLAEHADEGHRFTDAPDLSGVVPGEIDRTARARLLALLEPSTGLDAFLGAFLTTYRQAHAPAAPERPVKPDRLARRLQQGTLLRRNPWARLAWAGEADGCRLFASGQAFRCHTEHATLLCAADAWACDATPLDPRLLDLLTELVNHGYLYLD